LPTHIGPHCRDLQRPSDRPKAPRSGQYTPPPRRTTPATPSPTLQHADLPPARRYPALRR
jgi:hypothetical protein